MKLSYPICLYPNENGSYTVIVPDLPGCVTEGKNLTEAFEMARDAASLWLLDEIEDNTKIPKATPIELVKADEYENGFVSAVELDMDAYAEKYGKKAVKKTLSIPAWLNTAAEEAHVNFSAVLQKGLMDYLDIHA